MGLAKLDFVKLILDGGDDSALVELPNGDALEIWTSGDMAFTVEGVTTEMNLREAAQKARPVHYE